MADVQNKLLDARGINIAHLNVASIMGAHKFDMMRQQVELSNLQVFCASESWLKESVPNGLVKIKGFQTARLDRSWVEGAEGSRTKRGGGLICYVKDGMAMNEFKYARLNMSTRDLEMQWVLLEVENMRKIVVINIYRPPQGNYKVAC